MDKLFNIPPGKFGGTEYQQYTPQESSAPQRHGFVTFWLWLGIIVSIISCISNVFLNMKALDNLSYLDALISSESYGMVYATIEPLKSALTGLLIIAVISGIFTVVGYIMLLNWKKAGFWLLVILSIVVSCGVLYFSGQVSDILSELGTYNVSSRTTIITVAGSFLGWIILWAILQIKKNGVSCWSQLD